MSSSSPRAPALPPHSSEVAFLLGIGFVGASTLMFEVLLTRIFSLTMWYHFAFVAISLALFGIAASGVAVELFRGFFRKERATAQMGLAAMAMALTITASFVADLRIPFLPFDVTGPGAPSAFAPYAAFTAKFVVLALPFFFSGLAIALAFSHGASPIRRTYFADLVGGGVGCALVVPLLRAYSGPSAILIVSGFALVAAALLLHAAAIPRLAAVALVGCAGFLALGAANEQLGFLAITRIKSFDRERPQEAERPKIYEAWHPTSRIAVHPFHVTMSPRTWYYSEASPKDTPAVLEITNDGAARTFLYPAMSDAELRRIFEWDISDLVYRLVRQPEVLVIGVGGGKDILAAKGLGARHVTGVELNPLMIEVAQDVFSDFSGAPYTDDRVTIVLGEGRNFIASRGALYDVIKLSGTDTWAASAVGAYALTENYLYTVEAMQDYLDHLGPGGFLTMTRFYPREALRLAALAAHTVRLRGGEPSRRLLVARNRGMLTVILKNGDLSDEERRAFAEGATGAGFLVVPVHRAPGAVSGPFSMGSERSVDEFLARIVTAPSLESVQRDVPVRLAPPTDDSPFFFNDVTFADASAGRYFVPGGATLQHGRALGLLLGLLKATTALTVVCILAPVLVARRRFGAPASLVLASNAYFLMLGLGFLLVEIPLLQQFILYLGHPVYATVVVLFSLLVSSGIGSLVFAQRAAGRVGFTFGPLLLVLALFAGVLPRILDSTIGLPAAGRLLVSLALMFPLGIALGVPFPMGLELVRARSSALVPWGWAVNGAASVTAPVLAMILAIAKGFHASLLAGLAAYAVAAALLPLLRGPRVSSPSSLPER